MARPAKAGLDYFPLDVNLDEKFDYIEAAHGIIGFGVVLKLYQRIYRCGYFIPWSEKDVVLFASRIQGATREQIDRIVNDCLSEGIFSKEMFDVHKILTSSGIQKRYLLITKRREKRTIENGYCLVQLPVMADVPVDNKQDSVDNNAFDVSRNATKESKEKETKENQSSTSDAISEGRYPLEETLLQHWGRNGRLGLGVLQEFLALIKKHGWDKVEHAIQEAGTHGACNFAYARAIIEPKERASPYRRVNERPVQSPTTRTGETRTVGDLIGKVLTFPCEDHPEILLADSEQCPLCYPKCDKCGESHWTGETCEEWKARIPEIKKLARQ